MYTRIVVPLDGSELAERAVPEASTIARLSRAPMHLVRVVDPTRLGGASGYGLNTRAVMRRLVADEQAQATAYLEQTATRLRAKGLSVTTEVRQGAVVDELQRIAQPGDLDVIASHGRSGVVRWLLGSVAEELVRHSRVPVLIVRVLIPSRAPARVPMTAAQTIAPAPAD